MIARRLIDTATAYVSTSPMPCPMDSSPVGNARSSACPREPISVTAKAEWRGRAHAHVPRRVGLSQFGVTPTIISGQARSACEIRTFGRGHQMGVTSPPAHHRRVVHRPLVDRTGRSRPRRPKPLRRCCTAKALAGRRSPASITEKSAFSLGRVRHARSSRRSRACASCPRAGRTPRPCAISTFRSPS